MRSEKDIRLRIDLLEGQSSSIAKILADAIRNHNDAAYLEHSERLAANRGRIEELFWVLGEKAGQSVLDLQIPGMSMTTVRQAIEKIRTGELALRDLPSDAQSLIRKGALELRHSEKS
jgi:hypothetical protein